jgi:tetratricopeptide (TPR) repeat protein
LAKALDADPHYLEARLNLAGCLESAGRLDEAAINLEMAVEAGGGGDIRLLNRLAGLYAALGRREDSRRLLDESPTIQVMKKLMDSVWTHVNYWEFTDGLTLRERLEGVAAGIMSVIDGLAGDGPRFRLVTDDTGETISLEGLKELLYYNRREPDKVARRLSGEMDFLSPEHTEDWHYFIDMLYRDIQAEGMCLGDFSHSRRVFKDHPRLSGYDVEATFNFFRENLGPCDCHVFRWSEMGVTSVRDETARKAAACPKRV